MTRHWLAGLSIATLFLLMVGSVAAQSDRGTIAGSVQDSSGAVITGASVTLKAVDTGSVYKTVTGSSGGFRENDLAIGRTTPALFGLYSLVTRLAHGLLQADASVVRTAAWYVKPRSTFADAIAMVRRELWSSRYFPMSESCTETIKIPRWVFQHLTDTLCYAA